MVNKKRPKHNFSVSDLTRALVPLWVKECAEDVRRNDLLQQLRLLRPERGRLTRMMASEEPLSLADYRLAIRDMHSLITQDFTVLYLPGHEPAEGTCPVACYRQDLER